MDLELQRRHEELWRLGESLAQRELALKAQEVHAIQRAHDKEVENALLSEEPTLPLGTNDGDAPRRDEAATVLTHLCRSVWNTNNSCKHCTRAGLVSEQQWHRGQHAALLSLHIRMLITRRRRGACPASRGRVFAPRILRSPLRRRPPFRRPP